MIIWSHLGQDIRGKFDVLRNYSGPVCYVKPEDDSVVFLGLTHRSSFRVL